MTWPLLIFSSLQQQDAVAIEDSPQSRHQGRPGVGLAAVPPEVEATENVGACGSFVLCVGVEGGCVVLFLGGGYKRTLSTGKRGKATQTTKRNAKLK